MAICKIETLKVLSLRGCHNVGACFAYCALATRFGFNKIEKFDLRDTEIGDAELVCFGRKPTLKELLISGNDHKINRITERGIANITAETVNLGQWRRWWSEVVAGTRTGWPDAALGGHLSMRQGLPG